MTRTRGLRVAMFSYGLPAAGEKRGGIERWAHVMAQGLVERGHAVCVFTHDRTPAGALYETRPLPWRRFVNTWLGRRVTMGYLGNVLAMVPRYAEFDAIIAQGDSLLLPLTGKPVLRVMHGSAWQEAAHATSLGRSLLQAGVYGLELLTAIVTPATVAVSEATRAANPFVSHVIPHGVDTRVFHPEPREKTAHPSMVFVGTTGGRKRGSLLLDVFTQRVRPVYPDAELIFVGPAGPAVPGVSYHTGVEDAVLASLYRRAWVYASPSTYEGFGLPYLEAMACGTAVLATPNPGSLEVLGDPLNGRLAEDGVFGQALLDVLGDANRRRALESAGLLRARTFSLEAALDQYEVLLLQLCGAHAKSVASA